MNRSTFSSLYYKAFKNGSWLNAFLAINTIVFLVITIIAVVEYLFGLKTDVSQLVTDNLSMPASLPALARKFWTPLTYMFTHQGFMHYLYNMFWLFFVGRILEEFIAKRHFLYIYLGGGLLGAALYVSGFYAFPGLRPYLDSALLLGASGSVTSVVLAAARAVPDYSIMIYFIEVKLKYLALIFILFSVVMIIGNPGGGLAHLGGGAFGLLYMIQLQRGNDLSQVKLFKRRRRLKVVSKNETRIPPGVPDQDTIDRLLDKISRSGYESLSRSEKEQLFRASKNDETKK